MTVDAYLRVGLKVVDKKKGMEALGYKHHMRLDPLSPRLRASHCKTTKVPRLRWRGFIACILESVHQVRYSHYYSLQWPFHKGLDFFIDKNITLTPGTPAKELGIVDLKDFFLQTSFTACAGRRMPPAEYIVQSVLSTEPSESSKNSSSPTRSQRPNSPAVIRILLARRTR